MVILVIIRTMTTMMMHGSLDHLPITVTLVLFLAHDRSTHALVNTQH